MSEKTKVRTAVEADAGAKPVDRRVRRTKRRLKESLLELLEERDYERITIREITERADVGRSTFYSHYNSKESLLFSGFDEWLYSLGESSSATTSAAVPAPAATDGPGGASRRETGPVLRFSLPLLRHLRTQEKFVQAVLVRAASGRIRRRVTKLLAEVIGRELARAGPGPATSRSGPAASARPETDGIDAGSRHDARAHALAGAFLGLAAWWLARGKRLSPETVDALFQELAVLQ